MARGLYTRNSTILQKTNHSNAYIYMIRCRTNLGGYCKKCKGGGSEKGVMIGEKEKNKEEMERLLHQHHQVYNSISPSLKQEIIATALWISKRTIILQLYPIYKPQNPSST